MPPAAVAAVAGPAGVLVAVLAEVQVLEQVADPGLATGLLMVPQRPVDKPPLQAEHPLLLLELQLPVVRAVVVVAAAVAVGVANLSFFIA